ncbi:MAG: 4Fe-4S dicluster domain-containing protein [Epsilonproteobacteria bacterium]|nr:4Fe-4S dicluster domain-containing protein [Campylobacterota bacterium]
MPAPKDTPVWVDTSRCKACDICVDVCPAGVLAMVVSDKTILGSTISVQYPKDCIGCQDCELHCPDFAIFVATRKEYKFAKLTEEARERAKKIKENNYMALSA